MNKPPKEWAWAFRRAEQHVKGTFLTFRSPPAADDLDAQLEHLDGLASAWAGALGAYGLLQDVAPFNQLASWAAEVRGGLMRKEVDADTVAQELAARSALLDAALEELAIAAGNATRDPSA